VGEVDKSLSFISYKEFKERENITDVKLLILGDFYISGFIYNGLIFKDFEYVGGKSMQFIKINQEYINELRNNVFVLPTTLPMICPPNK
jgi:hypothetical protein